MDEIRQVLDFWFHEDTKPHWFEPTPEFDRAVRRRFAKLLARAVTGELDGWRASAEGCLALCILLDQVPRNIFRGDARAFAADERALAVAEHALARGFDRELQPDRKLFLYLPFMHSEQLANQLRALALYESAGLNEGARYAREHLEIIRRFGRFPHRNEALGRPTTDDEAEFLRTQGQDYGQKFEQHTGASEGRRYPEWAERGQDHDPAVDA